MGLWSLILILVFFFQFVDSKQEKSINKFVLKTMKFLLQTQMKRKRKHHKKKESLILLEIFSRIQPFFFFFCISEIFHTDREKQAWILKILFSTNDMPASWKCQSSVTGNFCKEEETQFCLNILEYLPLFYINYCSTVWLCFSQVTTI